MTNEELEVQMASAMQETEAILRANPERNIADPTLPIYRIAAGADLEGERERFEKGDRTALLGAIRICANHDMPLPAWASRAFIQSYDEVLTCKVGSWDEAFGRPYKKGSHLSRMRQARYNIPAVWLEVQRGVERGKSINFHLFHEIGRKLGIGKTRAEEYYAQAKRRLGIPQKSKN